MLEGYTYKTDELGRILSCEVTKSVMQLYLLYCIHYTQAINVNNMY